MQNVRLLSQWDLREMPGNQIFDMFHEVKIAQKVEKSANSDHNLIISEGCQDTSACKIAGLSLLALSEQCPENPNFTRFTMSNWRQQDENQQTMTKI